LTLLLQIATAKGNMHPYTLVQSAVVVPPVSGTIEPYSSIQGGGRGPAPL